MTSFHLKDIFKDPCASTEYLTESDVGRVYSGSEFKGTVVRAGQAWWQEGREAAGHVAPAVRRQIAMDVVLSSLSFSLRRGSSTGIRTSHIQGGFFPPQLAYCENSPTDLLRGLSPGLPEPCQVDKQY